MKYDIDILFKAHNCRVVFVSEPNDSIDIENAVYARNKRYRCEINKVLAPSKKCGPFKLRNKKSVWKILKTTKRIKEEGPEFLTLQLKHLDLYYYMDRRIPALSYQQRFRTSVSYEVLNGDRSKLLLNDCYTLLDGKFVPNDGKSSFFNVAAFFEKYDDLEWVPYDLIWITDMSPDAFFEEFKRQNLSLDFYSFYSAKDGVITLFDTKGLKENFESAKQKKEEPKQSKPSSVTNNRSSEEETKLHVTGVRHNSGEYGGSVLAMVKSGTVSYGDTYRSVRTGSKYQLVYPPVNSTYIVVHKLLLQEIWNDDIKKMGYDPDMIRNYNADIETNLSLEDLSARSISAGEFGELTAVYLKVMCFEGEKFDEKSVRKFDIEEDDILVKIDATINQN